MNRQTALKGIVSGLLLAATLAAAGCGGGPKIAVGSMNSTEQILLAEIVAQHLEHRLARKVERHPNLGHTVNAYQALLSGEINLYPEYSGSIVTEILKEQPSPDPSLVFQRARGEMKRTAQFDLFDPLGIDNPFVAVIRADDPRASKVSTLSEAAVVSDGWALGVTPEFLQLSDALPALMQYKLPMKAAPRSMDGSLLFKALEQGTVTMIVARATDGILTQTTWKTLRDDRNLFVPKQAALLVQDSLLLSVPAARPALQELSGKFTTEKMRKLNAQVDLDHLQPKDVAASFLMESGLR
jgi:glycine betaine/choline ABC-type transport system substrate-binding protein